MFRNYLKIALRNLWRNKIFSAINIFGLAMGLATCLLIAMYVIDELRFDAFHKHADRIYRINSDIRFGGTSYNLAIAPDPMGHTLVKEFPEVAQAVRFRNNGGFLVKKGNQNLREPRVIYADASLFEVFSFPLLYGDTRRALTEPNTMVITESIAKKYFGKANAIGKTLLLDNNLTFRITGVMRDIPPHSHIRFDFFLSMESLEESKKGNWVSHNFNTFLLLKPKTEAKQVEAKFSNLIKKYTYTQASQMLGIKDIAEFEKSGNYVRYTLMPLTKIHLHSDRTDELSPNGSIQYVYIFSAVALLILLIACTNFMNLSTAKSIHRAKEVGVRKVLGSVRKQLIGQFLVESIVLTLVSLLLAVVVAEITLPYFNQLANKSLSLDLFGNFYVISVLLGMALVVGILAGSYPAFYLSAFNPVVVLKGKIKVGTKGKYLRSALVVLQFGISIVLITCTLVIYRQLSFIQNKKVGFNKSQVLIINDTYTLGKQAQTFKQTVARLPEVERGTVSGNLPVPSGRNNMSYFPEGTLEQDKAISMQCWQIDEDYIQTLGMEIIQGRNFSKQFKTDSSAVIINESTAKLLGFENPIGKKIMRMDNDRDGGGTFFKIIGVVRNFHYESLRQNVQALCMHLAENNTMVSFKLTATTVATALPKIEALWKQFSPNQPFNYTFLDDSFESMYRNEQRIGQIFITFAGLAIFLAGLGLFGLVAFTTEQRTKEIGIRKVLGATVLNIIALISQDFLRLVLIAFLIASPVAYYLMRQWLQEFAYRVELHWLTFVIVGLLTGLIALLTMIYQAVKASLTNPVNVLRNE